MIVLRLAKKYRKKRTLEPAVPRARMRSANVTEPIMKKRRQGFASMDPEKLRQSPERVATPPTNGAVLAEPIRALRS